MKHYWCVIVCFQLNYTIVFKKKKHVEGIFISPGAQLVAQQLEGIDSYNDVIERRYTPLL